ncbi:MAG: hypothetical protein MUE72_04920 [Chitinophagaceae bacterium]|nr:hypothetical protein [Chitinophagaceae bacterium]
MIFRKLIFIVAIFFCTSKLDLAQDTLPSFTVRELAKGKVQISWVNPFGNLVQLIVQRSYDSTKYFRSIFSSQSPWLPQNGFVDNNVAKGYKVFYRIQYVFEGGTYFFTKSKSPDNYVFAKVVRLNNTDEDEDETKDKTDKSTSVKPTRTIKVYKVNKDTLLATIDYKDYKRYRDSITKNTKDTIQRTYDDDEIIIKPYIPKPVWKASTYIFTNEKGFVRVIIPNLKQHKYRVVFFEENNEELFQIKQVKEADLVLDKSNFYKSGWYYFELYEDEKLIEKNKFFVGKDR